MRGSRRVNREETGSRSEQSSRGSRFEYNKRGEDAMDKRRTVSGDRDYFFNNVYSKYKVRENENTNRLLPPTWENAEHYGYDVYVHYGIGPDKGAYLCLEKMKGELCPICEERQTAFDDGDQEYADDLKWSHGLLTLVIDRKAEKDGPQLWPMPMKSIDFELLTRSKAKGSGEPLNIDDPYEGFDFDYTKTGMGKEKTKYAGVDIHRSMSELGTESQMDEWLKFVKENPIPSVLQYYDYDHIAKVCSGKARESKEVESDSKSANKQDIIYSYEDIMDMRLSKLEKLALTVGFSEKELDDFSEEKLRLEVCNEFGIKILEENSNEDTTEGRLKNMQEKYSKKVD